LAVDHFGAKLIGAEATKSVMFSSLARLIAPEPYQVTGNASPPKNWRKSPYLFVIFSKLIEANANIMDFAGALATGGHDECFPHAKNSRSIYKKFLYYQTLPANILVDLGFIKLRLRENIFFRRLKKQKHNLPIVSGSDFLMRELTLLGLKDLERLIDILDQCVSNDITFSGHYFFLGDREYVFPARLSTANLAVLEFLQHVRDAGLDSRKLADELRIVKQTYVNMPIRDERYSYCYG